MIVVVLRKYWIRDELTALRSFAEPWRDRAGSTRRCVTCRPGRPRRAVRDTSDRHQVGELLGVRAGSVLGGLHHEYLPATALA
jgi:hypothetical protein